MQQGFPRSPPVNVGDEYEVKVEAVGEKGDGVVRVNGFVLFVPGVKEGDEIKIKINKVLSKVGFAEKVGQAENPISKNDTEENLPEVEAEPSPEDTEDFGEEPAEEDSEDETEEPAEDTEKKE